MCYDQCDKIKKFQTGQFLITWRKNEWHKPSLIIFDKSDLYLCIVIKRYYKKYINVYLNPYGVYSVHSTHFHLFSINTCHALMS